MDDKKYLAKFIDHTLLKATTTVSDVRSLCDEAKKYGFASVCVNSCYVQLCKGLLHDSDVKICTVVGFPLGSMDTASKVFEAVNAIENGANEIDMVINLGWLKSGMLANVKIDIGKVYNQVKESSQGRAILKVIIETSELTQSEKIAILNICNEIGVDFVKTSTGFASGGALVDDIIFMRNILVDTIEIKASGGIKDYLTAKKMISAGATRIGTSSGVAIIIGGNENKKSTSSY